MAGAEVKASNHFWSFHFVVGGLPEAKRLGNIKTIILLLPFTVNEYTKDILARNYNRSCKYITELTLSLPGSYVAASINRILQTKQIHLLKQALLIVHHLETVLHFCDHCWKLLRNSEHVYSNSLVYANL